ncbi:hypothetical protein [Streptomyces sp. NBC_00354]|uniref:hypothetical protein n=1 Tax=Streptomyces sp. NBC_00354 TaxID=2975723 RepID=UPI002E2715B9
MSTTSAALTGAVLAALAAATAAMAFSITARLPHPPNGTGGAGDDTATADADARADRTAAAERAAAWPLTGRLGRLVTPGRATAAEATVLVLALLPLPAAWRLAALATLFACFATTALVLHGRACGCFGTRLAARLTYPHAAACALLALTLTAGALASAPGPGTASITAAAGAATGAGLYFSPWPRSPATPAVPPGRPELTDHIVIYGSTTCPLCTILWDQQDYYRSLSRVPLEFRTATKDDRHITGGAVPAAVAYDHRDTPVTGPVHGLDHIRDLLHATPAPADNTAPAAARDQ